MAKKKVTHKHQDSKVQNPHEETKPQHSKKEPPPQPMMEDLEDKLQNLKTLNSMLLKETIEKRQQVGSLIRSKEALEAELSELRVESDKGVILEIEKALFGVFIDTKVREIGAFVDRLVRENRDNVNEIGVLNGEVKMLMASLEREREKLGKVCSERDAIKSDLDACVKEANGLREKVAEMVRMEKKNEEGYLKLKAEYGLLFREKNEKEKEIAELSKLKELAESDVAVRVKEIEGFKEEIERLTEEKSEVESERANEKVKIGELEREVSKLNETVLSVQEEEGVLRDKLSEMEKRYSKIVERERAMEMEIGALEKEKNEKKRVIESLVKEKHKSEQSLDMVNSEMQQQNSLIEKLLSEKSEIEEMKASKENELLEMHNELIRLRESVLSLQDTVKAVEEKNKKLALDVGEYMTVIQQVTIERDNAVSGMNEEKKKSDELNSKVTELVKSNEQSVKELAKLKNVLENLVKEKKEAESRVYSLANEKDSFGCDLIAARKEIDELRSEIGTATVISKRVLTALKNTSAIFNESINGKDDIVDNDEKLEELIESYVMELEVIKTAYMNKEAMVEKMKQQVESLQKSVVKANEKKSFWTIVSSATTIFAAVTLAYVARLR